MKKEKLRKENSKGITLIALVITIIVLLILAAVTIATLTGENGILTKANQAKDQTEQAKVEEQLKLAKMATINSGDDELNKEEFIKNLKENGFVINNNEFPLEAILNGNTIYIDEKGNMVKPFDEEEWDKTATPEDCFVWGSDTPGEEDYNLIVGYTSNLTNYTKVRIPSRCQRIRGRVQQEPEDEQVGRAFFTGVEKVEIPNTVKEIGMYAFWSGAHGLEYSLKEVVIPSSVTSIGHRAFCNCKNLSTITIPNSVMVIDNWAFEGWTDAQTINCRINSKPDGWVDGWDSYCNSTIVWGYTGD